MLGVGQMIKTLQSTFSSQPVLLHSIKQLTLRGFNTTPVVCNFWEPDKKSGYKTKIKKPSKILIKDGFQEIKGEVAKFKEEVVTKLRCDNLTTLLNGDHEIVWKFDNHEVVNTWIVTADSDHNEGQSKGAFLLGANQKGVFRGYLNAEKPKNGIIKNSGYCNIRSPKNMVSFRIMLSTN